MKSQLFSVVKNAHRLISFLTRNQKRIDKVLILAHDYPDPDSLASAFALQAILEKGFSIPSRIAYGGIIGRVENRTMVSMLKIPARKFKESDFKNYEYVALMDTQPHFHNNSFPKNRRATIVIDQHPSDTLANSEFSIIDETAGATCVILAQALFSLKIDLPQTLATALIYGITTDTLNLHRATNPIVFQTYLRLLPFCDMRTLAKIQNPAHSKKFFLTIQRGISHAMIVKSLIFSHLGTVENPDLVAQTSDFLLSYRKLKWALCTGRFKGRLYVSFRMKDREGEAGELLREVFQNAAEAGGHGGIAGGSFYVGEEILEEVWIEKQNSLIERLKRRLRLPIKQEAVPAFTPENL